MTRQIRVRGERKKNPDVRLFVLALLELARELEAKERTVKGAEGPAKEVDL